MESLPKGLFLKYNENTLESVRKLYGLDKPGAMEDAVNILEEWVKMQPHFTKKDFDRKYLETTIIVSKGSIEKAKARLDRGCTLRTLMPHIFGIHDIRHLLETELKGIEVAFLPRLTKDNIRVFILRIKDGIDMLSFIHVVTFALEYIRRYDYAETSCLVVDFVKTDVLDSVKRLTAGITYLQNLVAYSLECCGIRLKTVYIISSSKLIDTLVTVFKQVLSAKLKDRIYVVQNKQLLTEIFDIDIMPREFGGNEKSLIELQAELLEELTSDEHIEYMKQMNSARTDETRRQSAKFNEEYLGMPGSFRKLDVD